MYGCAGARRASDHFGRHAAGAAEENCTSGPALMRSGVAASFSRAFWSGSMPPAFEPKSTGYCPRVTTAKTGAEERIRTQTNRLLPTHDEWVDITLPVMDWCRGEDSNLRPTHYECVALPAELPRRLEHDPEKWEPVFRQDHAPVKFSDTGY